jgi:hypothetical protein
MIDRGKTAIKDVHGTEDFTQYTHTCPNAVFSCSLFSSNSLAPPPTPSTPTHPPPSLDADRSRATLSRSSKYGAKCAMERLHPDTSRDILTHPDTSLLTRSFSIEPPWRAEPAPLNPNRPPSPPPRE